MKEIIKVVTHSEDIDGAMCAILPRFINKEDVTVDSIVFSTAKNKHDNIRNEFVSWLSDVLENKDESILHRFMICDLDTEALQIISMMLECEKLENRNARITIIDHHQESRKFKNYLKETLQLPDEEITKTVDIVTPDIYDGFESVDKQSAASTLLKWMIWENYLDESKYSFEKMETLKNMTTWVSRYDTWRWKENPGLILQETGYPVEMYFHTLFGIMGLETFITTFTVILEKTEIINEDLFKKEFIDAANFEYKKMNKFIDWKRKEIAKTTFGEYNMGMITADSNSEYISITGNTLCEENPDIDFLIILYPSTCGFSLRSTKNDLNCARIAKFLGEGKGGGHPKASGGSFTRQRMFDFLNNYYTERDKKLEEMKKVSEKDMDSKEDSSKTSENA